MDIFSVPWSSIADGLPQVPSRPVEFKLVAGGDSRQICSSCGLAPSSFWLTSARLWNQAFSLSCPLFSELHPALDIPGHSHVHNASLKAGLIEILQKSVRVNIFFCVLRDTERDTETLSNPSTNCQQRVPHHLQYSPCTTLRTVLIIRLLPCFSPFSFAFHYKHDEVTAWFCGSRRVPFLPSLSWIPWGCRHTSGPSACQCQHFPLIQPPRVGTHPSVVVVSPHSAVGSPCDAAVQLNRGPLTAVWAWIHLRWKVK